MNFKIIPSLLISVLYFIIKFIEMRFIKRNSEENKETKSLKNITLDSFVVFISSVFSFFIIEQFKLEQIIGETKEQLSAFTNNPDF
tara:strand:+ start:736 stop:993 length:258 start_codon:yes stop_codon:yes gene_type:complete